jgi:tRNA G46 methylase TrmB
MLKKYIKQIVVKPAIQLLKNINIHLNYVPKDHLTGFDLEFDLTVIIPEKRPICIDIGANKGQTIHKFHKIFKSPYIYAFEPSTEVFEELKQKFSDTKTKIFNIAVGSTQSQNSL